MKPAPVAVICFALSGCQGESVVAPPPASAPPASPALTGVALPQAPPAPAPPAPAAPPPLSIVVEGACKELGVGFFDNVTVVHYGDVPDDRFRNIEPTPLSSLRLAFVRDDGSVVEDADLMRGIPDGHYPSLDLGEVSGTWPTTASLVLYNHGGERVSAESNRYVRQGDRWMPGERRVDSDATNQWISQRSWLAGSHLEPVADKEGYSPYPAFRVVPAGAAPTPDFTALHVAQKPVCHFDPVDIVTRQTGELFLAGRFCGVFPTHSPELGFPYGEAAVARWAPGGPARLEPIPPVAKREDLFLSKLVEASPTALYLVGDDGGKPYLALYNGLSWSSVPTPFRGYPREAHAEPDGRLWIQSSKDELGSRALVSGEWTREPLEPVTFVLWANGRPTWAVAGGVLERHEPDGHWTAIPAPKPAFAAADAKFDVRWLSVSPRGEVWARAAYEERRPEWTEPEPREALLRLGATAAAPTHCEEAKVNSSFTHWPPPATAGCANPVAILARVAKKAPPTYDYPQTRAALRGHQEVAAAELVEIEIDGKRLLAATVPTLEVGKRLVEIEGRGVRGTRPELVCTKPRVTRALDFDFDTGTLRLKR
jgi:hypothetical protein